MRIFVPLLLAACVTLSHASLQAGPVFIDSKTAEQALRQLREQYDEDSARATAPVERQYQAILEQLLSSARKAEDLETVRKIESALALLPQVVGKDLEGVWALRADTGYAADVSFWTNGLGYHSAYGKFHWRVVGNTLYFGAADNKSDRFELPLKNGYARGINSIGNVLTIRKK